MKEEDNFRIPTPEEFQQMQERDREWIDNRLTNMYEERKKYERWILKDQELYLRLPKRIKGKMSKLIRIKKEIQKLVGDSIELETRKIEKMRVSREIYDRR